jgi:hypothetical protein
MKVTNDVQTGLRVARLYLIFVIVLSCTFARPLTSA